MSAAAVSRSLAIEAVYEDQAGAVERTLLLPLLGHPGARGAGMGGIARPALRPLRRRSPCPRRSPPSAARSPSARTSS